MLNTVPRSPRVRGVVFTVAAVAGLGAALAGQLPFEYRQLEYLEQDSGGWVDTQVDMSKNATKLKFAVQDSLNKMSSGDYKILGKDTNFAFTEYAGNWRICTYQGKWQPLGSGTGAPARSDKRLDVTVEGTKWTFAVEGDETEYTYTATTALADGVHDIGRIFFFNNARNSASAPQGVRIFYFQLWETVGGVEQLTHDIVPVARRSDAMLGYYDLVTETFVVPNGTLKPGREVIRSDAYCVVDEYDTDGDFVLPPTDETHGFQRFTAGEEVCINVDKTTYPTAISTFKWQFRGWTVETTGADGTTTKQKGSGSTIRFVPQQGEQIVVTLNWGRHQAAEPGRYRKLRKGGYRPIEYAMNTNDSTYVDTGYTQDTKLMGVNFALVPPGPKQPNYRGNLDARWFGAYGSHPNMFVFGCINGQWRICTYGNTWQQFGSVTEGVADLPVEFTARDTDWTWRVNGGEAQSYTSTTTMRVQPNLSIYLFSTHSNGRGAPYTKFYYWRAYEDDGEGTPGTEKVVHDFVPAVRESDGVTGFYDLITDEFKTPTGAALVPGHDVDLGKKLGLVIMIK